MKMVPQSAESCSAMKVSDSSLLSGNQCSYGLHNMKTESNKRKTIHQLTCVISKQLDVRKVLRTYHICCRLN